MRWSLATSLAPLPPGGVIMPRRTRVLKALARMDKLHMACATSAALLPTGPLRAASRAMLKASNVVSCAAASISPRTRSSGASLAGAVGTFGSGIWASSSQRFAPPEIRGSPLSAAHGKDFSLPGSSATGRKHPGHSAHHGQQTRELVQPAYFECERDARLQVGDVGVGAGDTHL